MGETKTEIKVEGISKEQARKWEEKLFQRELVRAGKNLAKVQRRLKVAKARVKYWEGRCNTK